jgi:hypothetical protein
MATAESLWYADYVDGRPPLCNRLTRLPKLDQLGMALDFAVALHEQAVGGRPTWIHMTGETTWHWPQARGKNGDWWMLPIRTVRLARRVIDFASAEAARKLELARAGQQMRWSHLDLETMEPTAAFLARRERLKAQEAKGYHALVTIELERLLRRSYRAREALRRTGEAPAAAEPWKGPPKSRLRRADTTRRVKKLDLDQARLMLADGDNLASIARHFGLSRL